MATIPGLWQVLVPLPGTTLTNLVTNPSPQLALTGYTTDQGGTTGLARDGTKQRRGAYAFKYTPLSGANQGFYFALTLTSGHHYYFSCDLLGQSGIPYRIGIFNTSNVLQGNAALHTGTGYWAYDRLEADWTAGSTATFRLRIEKNGSADTNPFWGDGLMLIDGTAGLTYFDGAQPGALWTGSPYASTSQSDPETREIGQLVDLSAAPYNFAIEGWAGTGLPPLRNVVLPYGLADGGYYQRTKAQPRSFNVSGNVLGTSQPALHADLKALTDALKPDLVARQVPTWWRYRGNTVVGSPPATARALWIKALVDGGLEDNYSIKAGFTMPLALKLLASDPYWYEEGWAGAALSYQTSLANADYILKRSPDGVWSRLSGASALNGAVYVILKLFDGTYAVGGAFTNAGGVANADYLAHYDPVADVFTAFNATPLNAEVRTILQMPNGNLLIGGEFINAGADANADYICQMNIGTGAFSSINATPIGAVVRHIVALPNGNYAMAGKFTNAGADANADYIAQINGTTFVFSSFNATPLSSFWANPDGNVVNYMAVTKDNNLVLSGTFLDAGGDTTADIICKLILSTGAFESLTGVSLATTGAGQGLAIGLDGTIYGAGGFSNGAGDANIDFAVKSNDVIYSPLATGFNAASFAVHVLPDGSVLWGGTFTTAGNLALFDRMALWNLSAFVPMDVDLPGSPTVSAFESDIDRSLYIGYNTAGTAFTSAITTVMNPGTAKAYSRMRLTGPGTVYQIKNWTTGDVIYFNLTLLDGETAVLDLTPGHITFISSLRGNILNSILPGSNLFTFRLLPGANNIGVFIAGSTSGNTAVAMQWRNAFWSLDGGAN